ncbi:MAG: hypothetical protein JWM80_5495 [Cyanobacteria bacterium RYN_339]|nr:hypothetical protein [Cyanobacteria bacterium RYN_339]
MSDFYLHTYDSDLMVPATGIERLAAASCHGAMILALPFLLPLGIYILYPLLGGTSAYVRHQALQAMLFHLFFLFITTAFTSVTVFLLHIIILGWPFAAVTGLAGGIFFLWGCVVMVIATLRAFQGRPYRMPLVGGWGR